MGLKALDVYEGGRRDLSAFPDSSRELLIGYAAGYNRYLAEVGVDNVPGWCRGEAWVGEIDAVAVAAYRRSLYMTSALYAAAIGAARPPGQATAGSPIEIPQMMGASNGWGIGSERTESGGFALDVPLGELQHSNKNGGRIPIHGGNGAEGVTNIVSYAGNRSTLEPTPPVAPLIEGSATLRSDGYPINRGTSFIMTLEFTDNGPRAAAMLT